MREAVSLNVQQGLNVNTTEIEAFQSDMKKSIENEFCLIESIFKSLNGVNEESDAFEETELSIRQKVYRYIFFLFIQVNLTSFWT